jgi:hypothetical protein
VHFLVANILLFCEFFLGKKKLLGKTLFLCKFFFKTKDQHFCKIKKMVLKIYNNAISLHGLIMKEDLSFLLFFELPM